MTHATTAIGAVTGTIAALPGDSTRGLVRVQSRYATGIDDLWKALTEPARLARWVADVSGDLRQDGIFNATFTSGWSGTGRVETCQPPHRLILTMGIGDAGETTIDVVLSVDGEYTTLVIEERGLPLGELPEHGAGWQTHLEDFAAYLTGRAPHDWTQRWQELLPSYRDGESTFR